MGEEQKMKPEISLSILPNSKCDSPGVTTNNYIKTTCSSRDMKHQTVQAIHLTKRTI